MKGFINILAIIAIGVATILSSAFYVNYKTQQVIDESLGATIITTNLTDTIGTFRTNTNTSLTNINTELGTVSSTINAYGNITSENTPLVITKGGTGTTTQATANYYASANSTSTIAWKQFLEGGGITISHNSTSTTFTAAGFNTADNYNLTGSWTFNNNGTSTFNTTSTFNGATNFIASTTFTGTTTINNLVAQGTNNLGNTTFSGTQTFNGNMSFATTTTAYTNAVLWQYLGASTTATTAVNSQATAAIVNFWGTDLNCVAIVGGEVTIFKTGKTVGYFYPGECNSQTDLQFTISWSGSTITISANADMTINSNSTVFWYK